MSICLTPARAAASRQNGAKSKGPRTPEGKARSAQNALRHGLRAQKYVVLPDEDAAEFEALEAAIVEELAPEGALQMALVQRVVAATWRLARAERIESELFAIQGENPVRGWGRLGLAVIRDCNGAGAFGTLLRYRGGTLAELWRALRTLKALQAERAARSEPAVAEPDLLPEPCETPMEPESRANPGVNAPPALKVEREAGDRDGSSPPARARHHPPQASRAVALPSEPDSRNRAGCSTPPPPRGAIDQAA